MSHWNRIVLSSLLVSACVPDPGGAEGGSSSADGSTTSVSTSATTNLGTGQTSADVSSGDATTMVDPTTVSPTTTEGPDDTSTSSSGSGDESSSTGAPPVCLPVGPAGLPGVNPQAIWISNHTQGTVSKINTVSMIEEGRYATRALPGGEPSATSVSLDGDVAVANRNGGLTKFYGDLADCVDANGDGVITTSSGGADVLPWDDEECRAWFLPGNYTSQLAVAWTPGTFDEDACEYVDERVWTSGAIDSTIEVVLVDGETGVEEDSVILDGVDSAYFGFVAAAVDGDGNLWGSQWGTFVSLVRVDAVTLDYEAWPMPTLGYGMTVGASGYVFTCAADVARFDPATETWLVAEAVGGGQGCAEDGAGNLWVGSAPVLRLDVATMTVAQTVNVFDFAHGISIDFAGQVWAVSNDNNSAYRIDPATGTFDTFVGLGDSYTISDMTGFGLAAVAP